MRCSGRSVARMELRRGLFTRRPSFKEVLAAPLPRGRKSFPLHLEDGRKSRPLSTRGSNRQQRLQLRVGRLGGTHDRPMIESMQQAIIRRFCRELSRTHWTERVGLDPRATEESLHTGAKLAGCNVFHLDLRDRRP